MTKTFTWCLLLMLFAGSAWSQVPPKNMSLLSHIPYPDITADVAGYVGAGVEYAIIGHETGTTILSLANPSAPTVVQEIPAISATMWHEVDVYQHFAYVTNEAGDGLRIIDLSGLPGICAYKDTLIANMSTGHTLMASGDRLYIFGSNVDQGGASVLSLVDPWRPVHIGAYTNTYVHDAYVRGDTCYMGEIYLGFLTMVDMSNPASPVVLGSVQTPSAFTHNSWLNDAGTVCFTTDEVDAAYVTAYDVTNPSNISEIGRYRSSLSNGQSIPHNVKVRNDFLVVAYYKDGVNIVDASRPHNMIEVGHYDTNPQSGGGFDGNWGLECYLPSGTIVACDMSEGVWVLAPNYVRACYLEGMVTDVSTGLALPGVHVTFLSATAQTTSDFMGDYATGVADAGTYQVRYSKYGYRDSVVTVTMANGVLNQQDIALTPNARVQLTVHVIDAVSGQPIPNAGVVMFETSNQVKTAYVSDANGVVSDTNFMSSNYDLIAGQWGYVTSSIPANANAPTNNYTIALNKGYYDDFAFDFGWTVTSTAIEGDWEKGEPVGTPFYTIFANPEEDAVGDYSDECLVTGNGGGGPFDDDVDHGTTHIQSPAMDLSGYINPWLIFDYWFLCSDINGTPGFRDSLKVTVSNGIDTKIVWSMRDQQLPLWITDTVQLASFITITNNMHVTFSCGDLIFDHLVEAGIDRVRIEDQTFVATSGAAPSKPSLWAYPNPSSGSTFINYDIQDQAEGTISIIDLDGRELKRIYLQQSKGIVSLDETFASGMYFVVLESGGKRLATQKLLRF
jgi:choice-of-anchor B domain-containing protein